MKKLLAILLSITMVLTLVAVLASCGETSTTPGGETEKDQGTPSETEKEPDVSTTDAETKDGESAEESKTETKKETKESKTRKPTETFVNPKFGIVKLAEGGSGIVIDGDLDLVYEAGEPLFCGVEECKAWTANSTDESKIGGGIVGGKQFAENYTNADFAEYFYFAFDNEYLYICEYRIDNTPNYTANTFRQPYAGDGSLIWFTKNQASTPVGGIQWNAAVKGDGAGEDEYSETPVFGWFTGTNEGGAVKKDWESKLQQFEDHYCLELKIPLADISITAEDIENGYLGFTFCTVDVIEHYDGVTAGEALWQHAYQLQFPGVLNWGRSYEGQVVNEPDPAITALNAAVKDKAIDAIKLTLGTGSTNVKSVSFDPAVDMSKASKVRMTFQASEAFDLATLDGSGQLEITSSGTCDKQEYHWDFVNAIKGMTLDSNNKLTLELDLSTGKTDGNTDGGVEPNWEAINFVRIYVASNTAWETQVSFNLVDIAFS